MAPRSPLRSRFLLPLLALLAAVAALTAWLRYADPPSPSARQALAEQRARTARYAGPPNSIAVLPFRPEGREGETSAEAFGFSHDLLQDLARWPGLQVIAPTSSLYFRDRPEQRRRSAGRLRSTWLVAGEWRRTGDDLQLVLELFDAGSGRVRDRWTLEAPFDDPPARVREVAVAVVQRLPLEAGEAPGAPRRIDAGAWLSYAEGVFHSSAAGEPDLARAEAALRAAVEGNDGFAAARLQRAELLLHPGWPVEERGARIEEAREIAAAVRELEPGNGRALALLAWIRHDVDWDWGAALELSAAAVEIAPGDAAVLRLAGLGALSMGDFGRATGWLAAAAERDPLNLGGRLQLGLAQEQAREDEAALLTLRQVAMLNPDVPGIHAHRARLKLLEGKPEVARDEAGRETHPVWAAYANALALAGLGRDEEARRAVDGFADAHGAVAAFQAAELLALQGRSDEAFAWLERAVAQRDGGLSRLPGNRLLAPLADDPRWAALLERLGLPLDSPTAAVENG